ncbi:putative HIT-like protein [bacterium HR07]|uniref:Histidine triad protein n=1 Tax=Acetithermum autotrophicum TaxID=1446466 RepID=H5SRK1_ACEAU|nr:histidine triad protein [Candidatus Acetothermum autotrophicum]GBC76196.1 putative HIT-like protein [bacterium HR07]
MECIFCKIVRGELDAHKVYEDSETMAFLDRYPMTDGHTLVIPKVHAERLSDLPPELAGKLFQTVQKVTEQIARALGAPAFNIGFNDGRAAGQAIPHLHCHIIPRFPGDGGGSMHSIISTPQKRSLEETHRLIAHKP